MALLTLEISAESTMEMGDLATWISAIGTLAAVIVALGLARRDGSMQRKREQRHQAELITAWLSQEDTLMSSLATVVAIQNASTQSAYEVIVSLVALQGAFRRTGEETEGYRCFIGQLPPGRTTAVIGTQGRGMSLVLGVEIAFRDASGNLWRRRGNGILDELNVSPPELYKQIPPLPWGEGSEYGNELTANRQYSVRSEAPLD